MKIIDSPISLKKLWQECESGLTEIIKIVLDIENKIIAVDAEMHADLEELLLEKGSKQEYLWGANLYPEKGGEDFIEYTAFINIRPALNNRSMEIEDENIRREIEQLIDQLILR
jgi:hypothetical protein